MGSIASGRRSEVTLQGRVRRADAKGEPIWPTVKPATPAVHHGGLSVSGLRRRPNGSLRSGAIPLPFCPPRQFDRSVLIGAGRAEIIDPAFFADRQPSVDAEPSASLGWSGRGYLPPIATFITADIDVVEHDGHSFASPFIVPAPSLALPSLTPPNTVGAGLRHPLS